MRGILRAALVVVALTAASSAPAQVSYVGAGTGWSGSASTTGAIGVPPGITAGDVLVLVAHSRTNAAHSFATNGTGWAAISSGGDATGGYLSTWWKRTSGTESAPTLTYTGTAQSFSAVMVAFSGVASTGNPWDVAGTNTAQAALATYTGDALTTTVANTAVVFIVGSMDDDTWSGPAGGIDAVGGQMLDVAGLDNSVAVGYDSTPTNSAGAQAAPSLNKNRAADAGRKLTIALRPEPPVAPSTPGTPTLTNVTATGLDAAWAASTTGTTPITYTLEKSLQGAGSWSAVTGCSGAGMTSCTGSGLAENTSYDFRVVATNSVGSATSGTRTQLTRPGQPGQPSFSGTTAALTSVDWVQPTGGAESYRLERATDSGFTQNLTPVSVTAPPTTSSGLSAGTTYWFRVIAVNTTGDSTTSPINSVATIPPTPTGFAAGTPTAAAVPLSWNAAAGATTYEYDRATDPGFATFATTSGIAGSPTTAGSLSGNTTYHFRLRARNASGASADTGTVSRLTLPVAPALAPYTAVEQTTLTVSWTMAAPTGGLTYAVQRAPDSSGSPGPFADVAACQGIPATSCNDTGLTANTKYWYQVRATNGSGAGAWATATSVTTKEPPPPVPTGSPQAGSVTVSSMAVTWGVSSGASSYTLEVATDAGFASLFNTYSPNTNAQAVTGLASNTVYYLRVSATGPGGTSGWSSTGFATTVPDAPPGTPSFSGTTSSGTTVSWSAPTGNGTITSYVLDRARDAGFTTDLQTTPGISGATPTADVSGLSADTTYWFRVRAVNAAGTSVSSSPNSVTTAPAAATSLASGADPVPGAAPICPGDPATYVDEFAFSSFPTSDGVSALDVALGAGAGAAISSVEIRDAVGASLSPTRVAFPAGDTAAFASGAASLLSPLSPGATYRLYATPLSHALMPAGSFTLSARVSSFTADALPETGSDSAGAFTIDNAPLAHATWGTVTPGSNQIDLAWTNPAADAGAAVTHVVVLRRRTNAVFSETLADGSSPPAEGTTSAAGSAVVYSRAASAGAPVTFTDPGVVNGNNYVYRVYVLDGCGNWNAGASTGPHQPVGLFVAEGSGNPNAPMISIVNPLKGSVVSGKFRIQIRVANSAAQGGIPGLVAGSLAYRTTDAEAWTTAGLTAMTGYDTLSGALVVGRTYEVQLTPPADGVYTLRAKVSNGAVADVISNVVTVTAVAAGKGDGRLLVRDNSSQLCSDCHAIKSHTSEATGSRHGSWAMTCRDCHAPHGTRNVLLVNEQITPPGIAGPQSPREVVFYGKTDRARGDGKGVCQVCHTRTAFYRQDGTGATHETGNDCKKCHDHGKGLAATCTDCHGTASRTRNPLVLGLVDEHLAAAPPKDADLPQDSTNDAVRIGAHEAHVNQSTWRNDAIFCADCHQGSSHQGARNAGWSALASKGGTVPTSPATAFDATWEASPTCSNYCHGATLSGGSNATPDWRVGYTAPGTGATCGACHGLPPLLSTTPGQNHPQNTSCDDCHGVGYEAMSAAVKPNHIDGQYQGPANGCTACHGELAGPSGPAQQNTNLAAAPGYSATAVTPQGGIDPGAHDAHVRPTSSVAPASGQGLMGAKSCAVCHGSLPANEDVGHANGEVAIGWNEPASAQGVTPTYAGGSCTNYCHSDAKPLGAAGATTVSVSWAASLTFGCTDCHGNGTAGAALSPVHATHLAAPYAFTCDECHASVVTDNTTLLDASLHVNGGRNVRFSSTLKATTIDSSGGGYAGYTCSGTYCHSPGTKTVAFDAPVGPALSWNGGSASAACDDCHGGNASATRKLATGSHDAHVNDAAHAGQTYACATCHSDTVTADTTLKAGAPHVDGAKSVTAASWNGTTCSANSCHSNGKGTAYATATWGTPLGCNGCHGTSTGFGYPDYENGGVDVLLSNSHAKHIGTDPAVCATCHPDTTTDGATVSASHLNGTIDVRLNVPGTYTPRSGNTSPSCSSISCHGDVKWGGTLTEGPCSSCHLAAAAAGNQDQDDLGRWNGAKAWIDGDDWLLTGHGRASAFSPAAGQSDNAAPNLPVTAGVEGCYYCHASKEAIPGGTQTSIHNDPANPFRLANANWGGKGKNGVCLVCHDAGTAEASLGFDPDGGTATYSARKATTGARVSATHYGAGHPAAGKGGELCWDCHDPHGDFNYATTPNRLIAFMIHQQPVRTHELADPSGWGTPDPTELAASTVDFNAAATGSATAFDGADYTDAGGDGQYNGVCQVCHTATSQHLANGNGRTHMTGAQCTKCHSHDSGTATLAFVQATGCGDCHAANPTASGEHALHVGAATPAWNDAAPRSTVGAYAFGCGKCHYAGGTTPAVHFSDDAGGTTTTPYSAQVVFDWTSGATPYAAGTATNDAGPTGLVFRTTTGTCATYCHSNADPVDLPAARAMTYQNVTWSAQPTLACTACHGGKDAAATMSATHAKHVNTASGSPVGYAYECFRCHVAVTDTPGAVKDRSKHVDQNKQDVAFDTLNPAGGYGTGTYACSSVYCHSDGQPLGAASPTYKSPAPKWTDGALPGNCTGCHGGNAGTGAAAIATNRHGEHVNQAGVLGTNYGCVDCHDTTVSGDTAILSPGGYAQHVDGGAKDVGFPARAGGQTSGAYATPNCASNYCHSNGRDPGFTDAARYTTVAWNGAAIGCNGCHGKGNAVGAPDYPDDAALPGANSHAKHVGSPALAATCKDCHTGYVTADGTAISGSSHTDGFRNVGILAAWDTDANATNNYDRISKTCSSVKCHGTANSVVWGATLTCLACHTGTDGGPLADGNPNAVDDEWTTSGHGGAARGAATFTSGQNGCDYCHDGSLAHTPAPTDNPYRLRFSATTNALCLQCHGGTSDPGVQVAGYALENSAMNPNAAHDGAEHSAGEGGMLCWDCHDPHGVPTNIRMVKRQVSITADQYGVPLTTAAVNFTTVTCTAAGPGCFVDTATPTRTGVCQACHSPTGTSDYWRWDGTSLRTHNPTNATAICSGCHEHKEKFKGKGGGPDCYGCHQVAQGSRRPLSGDFTKQSHHVRGAMSSALPSTAGTGNNADCVVCHLEGQIITAASADCQTAPFNTCTNPQHHGNSKIDLRNVDAAAPAMDSAGTPFLYDKAAVASSAGAAGNWNSGNAEWRAQTSTALDPFCLGCHDTNGANGLTLTPAFKISTEGSRVPLDPFWDGTTNITNTYDGLQRNRVVDIKSKVSCGTPSTCSSAPPAQGTFARHAIRGQSTSKYTNYTTATAWPSNPNGYSTLYSANRFTSTGLSDENGRPLWNDASVMGCADCHTSDGANGTTGNAHGSDSEYLLKDASGLATEGTYAAGTANCFRCHPAALHNESHTAGNGGDFQDTVGSTGAARITAASKGYGTIFGMACLNCHGGAQGNGSGAGDNNGFGWIHGTSQVFGTGQAGAGGTRNAYRFMNGGGLRYYLPGNNTTWDTGTGTCYTLGGADTWSGCAQHSKGTGATTVLKRPLTY